MGERKMYTFEIGDIVSYRKRTYQVHENLGIMGLIAPFPAAEVKPEIVEWNDEYRKTGHQPLATESSCSSCDSSDNCSSSTGASGTGDEPIPLKILGGQEDHNPH